MSHISKKSSLSQLQNSISDTVSKAFTFVRESSFPSGRSNSPCGSGSLRIRCDELCCRASEELSRGTTSNPTVVTAQPEFEEPPVIRHLATDSWPTTPTTPITLTQTALQQSDGSTATLTSPAPTATFDHDQIKRAAGLWATEVPMTHAMSRSDIGLDPSSSRSRVELEGTTRGSSPANDSNAPVSRFSIDESSEEEDETDEDEQDDENDKDATEYATVLTARVLTVRRFESSSEVNVGEAVGEGADPGAEAETSNSTSTHGNNKEVKREHRHRVALSAFGPSSSGLRQAVEDDQSIAEDSESDESEPVVSEVQAADSSKIVGLAL